MNNLRVIGLPEGSKGHNSTQVVSGLLKNLLQLDDNPTLDRVCHSLRSRARDGDLPRLLVVRVCSLQDRDRIMCCASKLSPLYHIGRRISIFPIFTLAVAKKRASFLSIKKELRAYPNVKYGLIFSSALGIVLSNGQAHRFEDPALAADFINKNLKKSVVPEDI